MSERGYRGMPESNTVVSDSSRQIGCVTVGLLPKPRNRERYAAGLWYALTDKVIEGLPPCCTIHSWNLFLSLIDLLQSHDLHAVIRTPALAPPESCFQFDAQTRCTQSKTEPSLVNLIA